MVWVRYCVERNFFMTLKNGCFQKLNYVSCQKWIKYLNCNKSLTILPARIFQKYEGKTTLSHLKQRGSYTQSSILIFLTFFPGLSIYFTEKRVVRTLFGQRPDLPLFQVESVLEPDEDGIISYGIYPLSDPAKQCPPLRIRRNQIYLEEKNYSIAGK